MTRLPCELSGALDLEGVLTDAMSPGVERLRAALRSLAPDVPHLDSFYPVVQLKKGAWRLTLQADPERPP